MTVLPSTVIIILNKFSSTWTECLQETTHPEEEEKRQAKIWDFNKFSMIAKLITAWEILRDKRLWRAMRSKTQAIKIWMKKKLILINWSLKIQNCMTLMKRETGLVNTRRWTLILKLVILYIQINRMGWVVISWKVKVLIIIRF